MHTGLDRLAAGLDHGLAGRRVALLANHTAVDARGLHAVDVLGALPGVTVTRLLAPEHGVWSTHQDMEALDGAAWLDPIFGLPVASLYGREAQSLHPRPEALADVDAVVYDIQDLGVRYYTYAATLAFTMSAAAERGLPVWVLDRPNPVGPRREGPLLEPGFESFCGIEAGLPIRYGLTIGELARWYLPRRAPGCELHVVPCDPSAAPPWIPPSPNMPTRDTAIVYAGMCLLEGTTLSEGRGTTTPFLLFGAPGVDPRALAANLAARDLPGVDFAPRLFRPEFGKHRGERCGGVYIRVLDGDAIESVALGAHVLAACCEVAPGEWTWRTDAYEFVTDVPAIDLLWGSAALREALDARAPVEPLLEAARRQIATWSRAPMAPA